MAVLGRLNFYSIRWLMFLGVLIDREKQCTRTMTDPEKSGQIFVQDVQTIFDSLCFTLPIYIKCVNPPQPHQMCQCSPYIKCVAPPHTCQMSDPPHMSNVLPLSTHVKWVTPHTCLMRDPPTCPMCYPSPHMSNEWPLHTCPMSDPPHMSNVLALSTHVKWVTPPHMSNVLPLSTHVKCVTPLHTCQMCCPSTHIKCHPSPYISNVSPFTDVGLHFGIH